MPPEIPVLGDYLVLKVADTPAAASPRARSRPPITLARSTATRSQQHITKGGTMPKKLQPMSKRNRAKAVKGTVKQIRKLRKALEKSAISPAPARTGRGTPITYGRTTSWGQADAFVDDVLAMGSIPSQANGASQRAQIREIAQLRRALDAEKTADRKEAIGRELTKAQLIASHQMSGLAKGPYGIGNAGTIDAAGERAGVGGTGDLLDLYQSMRAGRIKSQYAHGPLPPGVEIDAQEAAEREAQLQKVTDPLERERLGYEATLAKLRAHARSTVFGSGAVGARRDSTVVKSGNDRIGPLQKHLDKLTEVLASDLSAGARAELQEQASAISQELTRERLRRFHEVGGR